MNKLLIWLTAISHPLSNTPICQYKCSIYALVVIKLNLMFCTMKFSKLHFKKCFDPKIANFCFRQRSNERFTMFISSQYSSCLTHQPPLLQFHLSERFIKTLFKRKLGLVFISKTSKTVVSNSFRQLAKKARLKDFDILPCSKRKGFLPVLTLCVSYSRWVLAADLYWDSLHKLYGCVPTWLRRLRLISLPWRMEFYGTRLIKTSSKKLIPFL